MVTALGVGLITSGCQNTTTPAPLRSLNQPNALAFVCYVCARVDVTDSSGQTLTQLDCGDLRPAPMAECDIAATGDLPSDHRMYAMVAQPYRGSVAALDIPGPGKSGGSLTFIDTSVTIPGFTFAGVGALPTGIVVPETDGTYAYVVHSENRELWQIETRDFLNQSMIEPRARVTFSSSPVALTSSPDGRQLFVALPDAHEVAVVTVTDGNLGQPQFISIPTIAPAVPAVQADNVEPYRLWLPSEEADFYKPSATPSLTTTITSAASAPQGFAWHRDANVLLITDSSQPYVHQLDPASLTLLTPLSLGAPTRAAVMTPAVPRTFTDDTEPVDGSLVHYLYAIDDSNGSVFAYDYEKQAVIGTYPADLQGELATRSRLQVITSALSLEVISPGYDPLQDNRCTPSSDRCAPLDGGNPLVSPTRLRGVFLIVGLADGSIRVIDVHDLDATCRGVDGCGPGSLSSDVYVRMVRHRPRWGEVKNTNFTIFTTPTIEADGVLQRVGINGVTVLDTVPDLLTLEACPTGYAKLYPPQSIDQQALLCYSGDPWVAQDETWTVTYNGPIPRTAGTAGDLDPATQTVRLDVLMCAAGVQNGDTWVVTAKLPDGNRDACRGLDPTSETGLSLPIGFKIVQAFNDRFVLEANSIPVGQDNVTFGLQQIFDCFGRFVSYEVRTSGEYAVVGSATGFLHRMHAIASGECAVDESKSALLTGRARPSLPFSNSVVALQIGDPNANATLTRLTFQTQGHPIPLGLSLSSGSLPDALKYNPMDRRLYMLDSVLRGLVQVQLDPLQLLRVAQ